MKSWKLAFAGAALTLAAASVAANASTYDWTLSGSDTGSGQLTTSGADVTGFWGTINGKVVSLATDTHGVFNIDNVVYPSVATQYLDNAGILMNYGTAGDIANVWGNSNSDYAFYTWNAASGYYIHNDNGDTFTLAVPETSTWALFLVGFGLAGVMVRGAARKRETAFA